MATKFLTFSALDVAITDAMAQGHHFFTFPADAEGVRCLICSTELATAEAWVRDSGCPGRRMCDDAAPMVATCSERQQGASCETDSTWPAELLDTPCILPPSDLGIEGAIPLPALPNPWLSQDCGS